MLAYLTGDEDPALRSLVGEPGDVNVDALFVDDEQRYERQMCEDGAE